MGKLLCIPCDRVSPMSDAELQSRIREIHALCLTNIAGERNWQSRARKALQGLIKILRDSSRAQLQHVGPGEILYTAVKILFYFEEARHRSHGKCAWSRKRDCKIARACYYELVETLIPEKSKQLVYNIVHVIHKEKLWRWEDMCWELARGLLDYETIEGTLIIEAFLECVENDKTRVEDARAIVRILYQILDTYRWPSSQKTNQILKRLLRLYHSTLNSGKSTPIARYSALRRGLEVCLRNTINNLQNDQLLVVIHQMCVWSVDDRTSESTVLDFGGTLEYAAYMHVSGLYEETLNGNGKIFGVLMRMLSSSSRLVSLLGNRVFQCLLDRQDNRSQFDTPKIFFQGTSFDIKLNRYNKEDKLFFQRNRQILHDSLMSSVTNHYTMRVNLEATYCTICLIAVEVPCGFTAAAIVCLAMNLQDFTREKSEMYREASYHVHGMVIAVMSLLCWIHDAKVFYNYVNKIMMERAQWAPHLNPPLKARYSFALHHILWDKPELYFVDWEARYGLWKCFRLRESQRTSNDENGKRTVTLSV